MTDELAADAAAGDDEPDDAAAAALAADKPTGDDAPPSDADKPSGDADKGDDKGADDNKGGDKPSELPENWRELAAGSDEDTLKLLRRYGSLSGVAKALKEKDTFIRSGKMKQAMPDASDEKAMAEWRKAEGVPDDATGYKLPEDVTKRLTDDDKPMITSFTEFAHSKNARPDVVDIATEWYVTIAEQAEEKRAGEDKAASEAAEESLRQIWGNGEYKGNLTLAARFVETIPGVGKDWSEARLPNGKRLGDIPEFMEWASDQGRATFGDVTFATSESTAQHANRKAEIETIMKSDISKYWADPKMQAEYQAILAREEKRK